MNARKEGPPARDVIDQIRRVHRILRARFADALLEMGVSFAQLEVMELLHEHHRLHPGAIGRALLITRQSAAHLVRQLEAGNHVEVWSLEDGSHGVRLTDEGRRHIRRCHWALTSTFECVDALDPDIRTRLTDDLRACEDVLRPRPKPWWLLG